MTTQKSLISGKQDGQLPLLLAILAAPAGALLPVDGWSQEVTEIIVSSRRREEKLQEVPVAITAFDARTIEKLAISDTADVAYLVPGVQFDQGFSAADTRIAIRGISSERGRTSAAVLVDGVDVTGENVTSGGGSSLLNTRLLDLERVEVVKGPQSALYGRNAFAGAISYITRQPSMDEVKVRTYADLGEYSTYDLRGSITGPVIPGKLALSLNAGTFSTDGAYENNNPNVPGANSDLNGQNSSGFRLAALYTPTDTLSLTGSVSYTSTDSDPRALVKVANANTFYLMGNELPAGTPPEFSLLGNMDYGQWLGTVGSVPENGVNLSISERTNESFQGSSDDNLLAYVKVDWALGAVRLKTLSSYISNEATLNEDPDFQDGIGTTFQGVGLSIANEYRDATDTRYYDQEFTLESVGWDRGFWLAGISGFWEDTHNNDSSTGWYNDANIVFVPGLCGSNPFQAACSYSASAAAGSPAKTIDRDTSSYSVFGLVGLDLSETARLTLEGRYIFDKIHVSTNTAVDRVSQYILNIPIDFSFGAPPRLPASATQRSSTFNPRAALDYRLTEVVMFYGSVAKGTKPAGFGTAQFATPQNAEIEQEELWAYELGTKTTWLDGSVLANAAVFFNQYDNRQTGVTVTDPNTGWPAAGIVNAAGSETKGFELELQWTPIEPLTLALAYAYVDAEWTDFDFARIRANTGGVTAKDMAICGNAEGNCDGAYVAGVPKNALVLQANWTAPLTANLEWFVNTVGQYQDKRAISDRVNTAFVAAYWNAEAQVGIQAEEWNVQVYVTNLFDNDTVHWAQDYNDFRDGMYGGNNGGEPRDETIFGFLPPPRTVGVRASYEF